MAAGASAEAVTELAEPFDVARSTVYRALERARLSPASPDAA